MRRGQFFRRDFLSVIFGTKPKIKTLENDDQKESRFFCSWFIYSAILLIGIILFRLLIFFLSAFLCHFFSAFIIFLIDSLIRVCIEYLILFISSSFMNVGDHKSPQLSVFWWSMQFLIFHHTSFCGLCQPFAKHIKSATC